MTDEAADERSVEGRMAALPGWRQSGGSIEKMFEFKGFLAAIAFVNRVAALAEDANHHPDIDIRWNKVTLLLTSHDVGGLTERDFSLAAAIESGE